eukprot:1550964-Amphidinium_carterae.1
MPGNFTFGDKSAASKQSCLWNPFVVCSTKCKTENTLAPPMCVPQRAMQCRGCFPAKLAAEAG